MLRLLVSVSFQGATTRKVTIMGNPQQIAHAVQLVRSEVQQQQNRCGRPPQGDDVPGSNRPWVQWVCCVLCQGGGGSADDAHDAAGLHAARIRTDG